MNGRLLRHGECQSWINENSNRVSSNGCLRYVTLGEVINKHGHLQSFQEMTGMTQIVTTHVIFCVNNIIICGYFFVTYPYVISMRYYLRGVFVPIILEYVSTFFIVLCIINTSVSVTMYWCHTIVPQSLSYEPFLV